jgi:ketosteroid isomerase-like protein
MTREEELIQRYFDAFNQHDVEGVMACFHEHPVIIDPAGNRLEGRDMVRRHYEISFDRFPDGRCDLRLCTGNGGRGVAESLFRGTRAQYGNVVEALGAEVMEIADGKIKEIRDYHQSSSSKTSEQRIS